MPLKALFLVHIEREPLSILKLGTFLSEYLVRKRLYDNCSFSTNLKEHLLVSGDLVLVISFWN